MFDEPLAGAKFLGENIDFDLLLDSFGEAAIIGIIIIEKVQT